MGAGVKVEWAVYKFVCIQGWETEIEVYIPWNINVTMHSKNRKKPEMPIQSIAEIDRYNNTPLDEFLGLTPLEIHQLVYEPYADPSPVQLRSDIPEAVLDQIPLFRQLESYLKIIHREKQIKLTPLGALPRKVLVEVYEKRNLPDEYIESGITKLWREQDCISISSARITAEIAGFVKKSKGKLTLTKTALKLIETNDRPQLFRQFFITFTQDFLWSYNDYYPEKTVGQLGWAFSILMLEKFGHKSHPTSFYAEKYLAAFPALLPFFPSRAFVKADEQFAHCYGTRVFQRFLHWFGFVSVNKQEKDFLGTRDSYTRTDLLRQIFRIRHK